MPDKNFTKVSNKIIRSKKLTPYDKAVLNVLLSYGSCDKIYLRQATIAEQANMSRDMVSKTIKKLKAKRYLSTKVQTDRATLEYKLLYKMVTDDNDKVTDDNDRGYVQERQGGTDENDTSNKSISKKSIDKEINKEIISPEEKTPPTEKIPYTKIMEYFAKVSGKKFTANNANTRKLISGRWNEGFGYDDFVKVIDNAYAVYTGNGTAKKNMKPSAVFNGKFEERLLVWEPDEPSTPNQPIEKTKEQIEREEKAKKLNAEQWGV